MSQKISVAVLYGGKSGEHEVSLRSAASVIHHLDRNRFDIVPVGIDKRELWRRADLGIIDSVGGAALAIVHDAPEVCLTPLGEGRALLRHVDGGGVAAEAIDVVFPVMHGPLCEAAILNGRSRLGMVFRLAA